MRRISGEGERERENNKNHKREIIWDLPRQTKENLDRKESDIFRSIIIKIEQRAVI